MRRASKIKMSHGARLRPPSSFIRSFRMALSPVSAVLFPMKHNCVTLVLVSTILLVGLTSLASTRGTSIFCELILDYVLIYVDFLLFYPLHLYKVRYGAPVSTMNQHTYRRQSPMETRKEKKRWSIFENLWDGKRRYSRGKQAFGILNLKLNMLMFKTFT